MKTGGGNGQDHRPALHELASVLRRLHKALVEVEAENFGPINGPYQLLNLVTNHEHFAWLRRLSELMVEIDERREDAEPVTAEQAGAIRATVEELVGPRAATAPGFRERYTTLLQQSPAAAMMHGDLRRLLGVLPNPAAAD